jgi:predicted membrane-bound mannosyltransferase
MLLVATKQSYWGFFFHAIATLITFNHVACCHVAKLLGFLFSLLPRCETTPFESISVTTISVLLKYNYLALAQFQTMSPYEVDPIGKQKEKSIE